jgi:nuclease A inhibitor-like protein
VDEFFARHTSTSDPYDGETQRIRPKYEELVRLLSRRLRDVKAYRIGRIEIDCYVAGLDAEGNLAGLRTVAIET